MPLTDEECAGLVARVQKTVDALRTSAAYLQANPTALFLFEQSPPLEYWGACAELVRSFLSKRADELSAHIETIKQRLPGELHP